ncbi:MAG: toxin-antitoxin system YwqK family antitoxin [Promethearchaeota archaeon]
MLSFCLLLVASAADCTPDLPKSMIDNDGNTVEFFVAENQDGMCVPHGEWAEIYPTGQVKLKGSYQYGEQHGKWVWWFANGETERTGEFKNGVEIGHWTFWHSSGKKMQEGYFCSGQQCSKWTQWWSNGNLRSEIVWQSGKINGSVINYFPNGHKAVTGQANQDKKVGEWIWWDNEGNVIAKKDLTK